MLPGGAHGHEPVLERGQRPPDGVLGREPAGPGLRPHAGVHRVQGGRRAHERTPQGNRDERRRQREAPDHARRLHGKEPFLFSSFETQPCNATLFLPCLLLFRFLCVFVLFRDSTNILLSLPNPCPSFLLYTCFYLFLPFFILGRSRHVRFRHARGHHEALRARSMAAQSFLPPIRRARGDSRDQHSPVVRPQARQRGPLVLLAVPPAQRVCRHVHHLQRIPRRQVSDASKIHVHTQA